MPTEAAAPAGLNIGAGLPSGYDASGAVWHPRLQRLFVVDDHGKINSMLSNGSDKITHFTGGDDFEGICYADENSDKLYLAVEICECIQEFSLSTRKILRTFKVKQWIKGGNNLGIEGLEFVPDPTDPEGGLFYAADQKDGAVHIFRLPIRSSTTSTAVQHISVMKSPSKSLTDAAGLDYDRNTGIMYILYDQANLIRAVRIDGTPNGTEVARWTPGSTNQEGVAHGDGYVFIASDSGPVARFDNYFLLDAPPPSDPPPAPPSADFASIGTGLPSGYRPSGTHWNSVDQRLFVTSDTGDVHSMQSDGTNIIRHYRNSNYKLKAITFADPNSHLVYLGREDTRQILELNLTSGAITRRFNLSNWFASTTQGIEGVTFVPDPSDPEGGLFYVGSERNGRILVFRLPIQSSSSNTTPQFLYSFDPVPGGRIDLSDLWYAPDTNLLYVLYDSQKLIRAIHPDGTFVQEWPLTETHPEGVSIGNGSLFLGMIGGGLVRYDNHPVLDAIVP